VPQGTGAHFSSQAPLPQLPLFSCAREVQWAQGPAKQGLGPTGPGLAWQCQGLQSVRNGLEGMMTQCIHRVCQVSTQRPGTKPSSARLAPNGVVPPLRPSLLWSRLLAILAQPAPEGIGTPTRSSSSLPLSGLQPQAPSQSQPRVFDVPSQLTALMVKCSSSSLRDDAARRLSAHEPGNRAPASPLYRVLRVFPWCSGSSCPRRRKLE